MWWHVARDMNMDMDTEMRMRMYMWHGVRELAPVHAKARLLAYVVRDSRTQARLGAYCTHAGKACVGLH